MKCMPKSKIMFISAFLIGWTTSLILSVKNIPTYDMYYMARLGEKLIANGIKPLAYNPMSILDNAKISIQQPFYCVFSYIMLDKVPALYGIYIGICLMLQGVMFIAISKEYNLVKEMSLIFSILGMIYISFFAGFRPFMFDMVLLSGEILCIKKYQNSQNCKYLIYLPICSLLLANLHAALALYSILFVLPFLFPKTKDFRNSISGNKEWGSLFLSLGGMILMSLATPFSPFSIVWIAKYVNISDFRAYIPELYSIFQSTVVVYKVFFAGMIVVFALGIHKAITYGCECVQELLLLLGNVILSAVYVRNLSFAPIAIIPMLSILNKNTKIECSARDYNNCFRLLFILLIASLIVPQQSAYHCQIPKGAFEYLLLHGEDIKILSQPEAGSYLNYYAKARTAVNCMPESGFKKMNQLSNVYSDTCDLYVTCSMDYFDKYEIDYALFCNKSNCLFYKMEDKLRLCLIKNGWSEVYADTDCVLFANPSK